MQTETNANGPVPDDCAGTWLVAEPQIFRLF